MTTDAQIIAQKAKHIVDVINHYNDIESAKTEIYSMLSAVKSDVLIATSKNGEGKEYIVSVDIAETPLNLFQAIDTSTDDEKITLLTHLYSAYLQATKHGNYELLQQVLREYQRTTNYPISFECDPNTKSCQNCLISEAWLLIDETLPDEKTPAPDLNLLESMIANINNFIR